MIGTGLVSAVSVGVRELVFGSGLVGLLWGDGLILCTGLNYRRTLHNT